ncbi:predicted protein [Aspergillus terreus NIH2624]|uniref:Berberine/berberine-like domain-containing protein n=1 Tax=Aspergillus terreus (strain NIH 2624 / FGSC A1156) TaxID=341663 RepID=Q0CRW4_ASPTN|nr:uncharacterized protein ATEG_03570 [Aspergillus terreus NIH2624]EAU36844.1 predicted protein [Aspergillus terreus NIH2624]
MNQEIMDYLLPWNGPYYPVSSKCSTHPSWAAWYASTHHTSTGAMKNLAPGTGTYGNEADPYDPDWKQDWFGDQYDKLRSIKMYDPEDVFWCWRCVGNEDWEEVIGRALFGPLCQVN